jgi:hypothetical protein
MRLHLHLHLRHRIPSMLYRVRHKMPWSYFEGLIHDFWWTTPHLWPQGISSTGTRSAYDFISLWGHVADRTTLTIGSRCARCSRRQSLSVRCRWCRRVLPQRRRRRPRAQVRHRRCAAVRPRQTRQPNAHRAAARGPPPAIRQSRREGCPGRRPAFKASQHLDCYGRRTE